MYLRKEDIAPIAEKVFPEYRGKTFRAEIVETVTFHDVNWSGGTRSTYVVVNSQTGSMKDLPNHMAPWDRNNPEGSTITLIPGVMVVKHSYFCGKDMGLTFYVHPADAPKMIKAPENSNPLTMDERIVLTATRSLKSSYAGIGNYRFHEARRETQITEERWNAALQSLMAKKLIAKNKAITPEGRNAIGNSNLWEIAREIEAATA